MVTSVTYFCADPILDVSSVDSMEWVYSTGCHLVMVVMNTVWWVKEETLGRNWAGSVFLLWLRSTFGMSWGCGKGKKHTNITSIDHVMCVMGWKVLLVHCKFQDDSASVGDQVGYGQSGSETGWESQPTHFHGNNNNEWCQLLMCWVFL